MGSNFEYSNIDINNPNEADFTAYLGCYESQQQFRELHHEFQKGLRELDCF